MSLEPNMPGAPAGLPPKQGLYDPQYEHESCGVGFVVNIKGKKSHQIVRDALTILINFHNGLLMPRTDIYRLDAANVRDFKITYLPMNFPFDERRVDDKFEMPSCQLTS